MTAPAFTFNPDITITPDHKLITTGTVDPSVTNIEIYEAETKADLGPAQISNGTWSFTQNIGNAPAIHVFDGISTDNSGKMTNNINYTYVWTDIVGEPYKAAEGNANQAHDNYWKFYSGNGTLEYHADWNKDANTFTETGDQSHTHFVFTEDYGAQTITNFRADGSKHDSVILPHADFANMADLLRDTTMSHGSAVIHDPNNNSTLTLMGVTKTEMKAHHGDFSFQGSGHLIPSF